MAPLTVQDLAAMINDDAEHYRYFWVCAAMKQQTDFWAEPRRRALLRPDVQVILDHYIAERPAARVA